MGCNTLLRFIIIFVFIYCFFRSILTIMNHLLLVQRVGIVRIAAKDSQQPLNTCMQLKIERERDAINEVFNEYFSSTSAFKPGQM